MSSITFFMSPYFLISSEIGSAVSSVSTSSSSPMSSPAIDSIFSSLSANSTFSLSVILPSASTIILILSSFPSVSLKIISCSPAGAGDFPSSDTTSTISPTSNVGDSKIVPSASFAYDNRTSSFDRDKVVIIFFSTSVAFILFVF